MPECSQGADCSVGRPSLGPATAACAAHRRPTTQRRHRLFESLSQHSTGKRTFCCRPVDRVSTHIDGLTKPPRISPARGRPKFDASLVEVLPDWDTLAQTSPEYVSILGAVG